jgi:lipid-A-disaccharide synthase-like uncharacterized protein
MKFWNLLRWIGTVLFVALLLVSWLGSDGADPRVPSSRNGPPRPAPTITR